MMNGNGVNANDAHEHHHQTQHQTQHHHNIRVVVFDLGGVLVEDLFAPLEKLLSTKYNFSSDEQKKFVKESIKSCWSVIKLDPTHTEEWFFETLWKKLGIPFHNQEAEIKEMKDFMRRSFRLFFGTAAIADRISKAKKRQVAMLSNHANEWFNEIMSRFTLYNVFTNKDFVISSHMIHTCKPKPDSYDTIFKRLKSEIPNLEKNQVLFLDDKIENVKAAQEYGINSFQFDARKHSPKTLVEKFQSYGIDEAVEV